MSRYPRLLLSESFLAAGCTQTLGLNEYCCFPPSSKRSHVHLKKKSVFRVRSLVLHRFAGNKTVPNTLRRGNENKYSFHQQSVGFTGYFCFISDLDYQKPCF